jgi:hypothetical protein
MLPVLVLLSSTGLRGAIEVEVDGTVDFSRFRTFAWRQGTPAKRAQAEKIIRAAVERELGKKGLASGSESADLQVVTHTLADKHTLAALSDPDYLGYWAAVQSIDAYEVGAGTLVVDLVDAATRKLVWRAVARKTVKGSVEKMTRKIDNTIRDMFLKYPSN